MAVSSIQVMVRLQPPPTSTIVRLSSNELQLDKHHFRFDHVFDYSDGQQTVFDRVGAGTVDNCVVGYNGCLFLYGQTGSGKTYTMSGSGRCNGLMQNSFEYLDAKLDEFEQQTVLSCTFVEIYNEQIFDLVSSSAIQLDPVSNKKVTLREDIKKGVFMEGVFEENVQSATLLQAAMQKGLANRHVGETMMNKQSSRSHAIFTVNLQLRIEKNGVKGVRTSKLHFVDLAGSERQQTTMAAGERLKQANNINKSLSVLGQVINSLSTKKAKAHVRYRDSKLTFLLRDSLGGNSKTTIIATVSSSSASFHETLSTLKFAESAKLIKIKAEINEECVSSNLEVLRAEVANLRHQLFESENHVKQLKEIQGCSHFEEVEVLKQKTEDVIAMVLRTLEESPKDVNLEELSKLKRQLESFMHPSQESLLHVNTEFDIKQVLQQNISLRNRVRILEDDVQHEHTKSVAKTRERLERVEQLEGQLRMLQSEYDTLDKTLEYQRAQYRTAEQNLVCVNQSFRQTEAQAKLLWQENNQLKQSIQSIREEMAVLEGELAQHKAKQANHKGLEDEIEEYEEAHRFLKQELAKMVGSKKSLTKNLLTYKDRLQAVLEECQNKDKQLLLANSEVARLNLEFATLRSQHEELSKVALQMDGECLQAADRQNLLRKQHQALLEQNQQLSEAVAASQQQHEKLTKSFKYELRQRQVEVSSNLAEFSTVEIRYQDSIAELESRLHNEQQQLSQANNRIAELQAEIQSRERLSTQRIIALESELNGLASELKLAMTQSHNMRRSLDSRRSEDTMNGKFRDFDVQNLQENLRECQDRAENLAIEVIKLTDKAKAMAEVNETHSRTINRLTHEAKLQEKTLKWGMEIIKEESSRLAVQVGQLEIDRDFYRLAALQSMSNNSDRVKQHVQREFHRVNVELKQLREQYRLLRQSYTEGLFLDAMSKEKLQLPYPSENEARAEATIVKSGFHSTSKIAEQLKQYEIVARELYFHFRWLFQKVRSHLRLSGFKQQLEELLRDSFLQGTQGFLATARKLNDLISAQSVASMALTLAESERKPCTPSRRCDNGFTEL